MNGWTVNGRAVNKHSAVWEPQVEIIIEDYNRIDVGDFGWVLYSILNPLSCLVELVNKITIM